MVFAGLKLLDVVKDIQYVAIVILLKEN